jgi:hypothetical protein
MASCTTPGQRDLAADVRGAPASIMKPDGLRQIGGLPSDRVGTRDGRHPARGRLDRPRDPDQNPCHAE